MENNYFCTINDLLLDTSLIVDEYSCPLCNQILYKAEIYQCKEGFWNCKECWLDLITEGEQRKDCKCIIQSINDLSRSIFIENKFSNQKINCPFSFSYIKKDYQYIGGSGDDDDDYDDENDSIPLIKDKENGCKQIITVEELDTHLKQCQFKFVECPNKKNGCEIQFRFNKLEILKDHEQICDSRFEKCKHCLELIVFKNLNSHQDQCIKTLIECISCKSHIERGKLKKHLNLNCPNEIVDCAFKANGCNDQMKRVDLSQHLLISKHMLFISESIEKQQNQIQHTKRKYLKLKRKIQEINENSINKIYENDWFIKNFTKSKKKVGSFFLGPEFKIGSFEFGLSLYPNGRIDTFENHLVIALFEKSGLYKSVTVESDFTLINKEESDNNNKNYFFENLIQPKKWYCNRMMKFEKINKNGFLTNDTLHIKFKIEVFNWILTPFETDA
ncbi:hypothetical protein ACTFIT_009385 [Dictyostelium discoideum]